MIAPLKTKLFGVEVIEPGDGQVELSAWLDDRWRERFSAAAPECRPDDITLPVAFAASPRDERSSILG